MDRALFGWKLDRSTSSCNLIGQSRQLADYLVDHSWVDLGSGLADSATEIDLPEIV